MFHGESDPRLLAPDFSEVLLPLTRRESHYSIDVSRGVELDLAAEPRLNRACTRFDVCCYQRKMPWLVTGVTPPEVIAARILQ